MQPQVPLPTGHQPVNRTFHGITFADPYEWLRDQEAATPYLEAHNQRTEQALAHLEPVREELFHEIKSRVNETDMSLPSRIGNHWYFSRVEEGKSYSLLCRVPVTGDKWIPREIPKDASFEVVLDQNALAEGHDFFACGDISIADSEKLLAYSVDTVGDERYTVFVKNLETGELLEEQISETSGDIMLWQDKYLFYTKVDAAWRPYQLWRHALGTDPASDQLVFQEDDDRFWLGYGMSRPGGFISISVASKTTSETWIMESATSAPCCLLPRQEEIMYDVDYAEIAGEKRWLVTHNATGSNFELGECAYGMQIDLTKLTTLVPHDPQVRFEGVAAYKDFLVIGYRRDAISRGAIMKLDPEKGYTNFEELTFPEELVSAGISAGRYWETPCVQVAYSSWTTPAKVFNLEVATGAREVLKEEKLPNYEPEKYTAQRRWVAAQDGVKIPVTLIHRVDVDPDGVNPVFLYGYGSYETTLDPWVSVIRAGFLDRGVVYAIAHIRGGGELGRPWYDAGKRLNKKNTFTDFIAVARNLRPHATKLVAGGGSAGGLLMGAVANMAPELFDGIFAAVPFVDPLTSITKPELPLTAVEWDEWGNPIEDEAVYRYMASYSPYENVTAQKYPNMLITTSLNDTRVLYVEPAKWVARLDELRTGGDILFKCEMAAGHGGVSGRYESWREAAFEQAWQLEQLGVLPAAKLG